jgi:bacteriocin-like protein
MNELLTRELTNDELALISGGGETDQANFGLREIYDYWDRQNWSMDVYDRNGDGDGWDEITHAYATLGAATGVVALNLAATPAGPPLAMATALLGVAMVGAGGIDTYHYGPNMQEH